MFTKDKNKRAAIAAIIIVLIIAMSCVLYLFTDVVKFNDNQSTGINGIGNLTSNTALNVTYPTSGELGQFANGYSYVFTDKDKVDDFRAGNIDFDMTTIKVDTTQSHGSQENPYVIASVEDWEIFVKLLGSNLSNSTGKYYVLASDLDFSGKTFRPVARFNGTFYGLGHKLLNIECSDWQYWTGSAYSPIGTSGQTNSGFGIFCSITNATITDLINEKFNFSSIPQTSANGVSSSMYGPYIGGLVGVAFGSNKIYNCHTQGEVHTDYAYSQIIAIGGLIGANTSSGSDKTVMFYRCSTSFFVESYSNSSNGTMVGGMLGQAWSAVTILECVSNVSFDYSRSGYCVYTATMLGWSETTEFFRFENVVGKIDIETSKQNYSGAMTGFRGTNVFFENAYVEGNIGTTTKSSLYAVTALNGNGYPTSGIKNINVVKSSSSYATPLSCSDGLQKISTEPKEWTGSTATSDMISAAKTFFGAAKYSKIWDTSKIGSNYEPDNSPVRNYLVATVTFKNLLKEDNEENIENVPTADYKQGDELPNTINNSNFANYVTSSKPNHVFKGWTMDKSGDSEPYTTLPSGVFGDVTMYAVWGLSEEYVSGNITTTLEADKEKIEYDSVDSITLTAEVKHTPNSGGMVNPSVKYKFKQNNKDKANNTTGKLSVKTVGDSGV